MLYKWKIVEEGRKSLRNASPKLPDEQVRLVWTMYVCAHRLGFTVIFIDRTVRPLARLSSLEYLQELEHATHLLSHY